jgi:hypothetical protein
LIEAQKNPEAELSPKVAVDTIGEDCERVGDIKAAIYFN